MGLKGQIVVTTKEDLNSTSKSNEENSMSNSSDESNEERPKSNAGIVKDGEGVRRGEVRRRRKLGEKRYNSFCSSVYDEDARWKALNEERPDRPCHKTADSPFTTSSGFHNFRGLLNWCIIILVFTTGRAALENLIKYGILTDPIHWYYLFVHSKNNFPMIWVFAALFINITLTYLIEKMAAKWRVHERLLTGLHMINLLFEISFPAAFVYFVAPSPFLSSPTLSITITIFLKLVSYIQVNKWCRLHHKKTPQPITNVQKVGQGGVGGAKMSHKRSTSIKAFPAQQQHYNEHQKFVKIAPLQHYPDNLCIKDLTYFLAAPTVCYELNYPRTSRIRIRFLFKRALEIFFLLGLILSLIQQWIYPTLENSQVLFDKMNYPMMLARILKLAVPNHFIWLISFYFLFHSCFNFVAELLRFGDRCFYKDWWNAENLQQFWVTWNIPIHRFCFRHIYKPMLLQGMTKVMANASVFMMSAVFHEYLFSIPLNMLRPWFLMSFFLQCPLVMMSPYMTGKIGNILMWLILILGQPMALMMYYHDYYLTHMGSKRAPIGGR